MISCRAAARNVTVFVGSAILKAFGGFADAFGGAPETDNDLSVGKRSRSLVQIRLCQGYGATKGARAR